MTLAEEIRTRRKSLGLTQAELAERIGTSQGRLGDYERGEVEPTITTLRALASVLGPFTIGEGPSLPVVDSDGWAWHCRTVMMVEGRDLVCRKCGYRIPGNSPRDLFPTLSDADRASILNE